MSESALSTSAAMLFERNDVRVLEAFRGGDFDYVDAIGEVSEADFFRVITERKILDKLAESYPSPRERHDVPLWVYMASNLSMRFHGEHHFHAFPFLVRCSSMIEAFGPAMGHKATHPETGDISLRCAGFNEKNEYDRQTPCDQDYLRKLAGDTDAELLQSWFNREVAGIFKQHHAFDAEGIFIGDASYLFVPDNEHYEGSSRLLFDEQNHPVDSAKLTREQQKAYDWRRCYKLVTLLHTNRAGEFFLYGGLFGAVFLMSQYFQTALGYSPLNAGLRLLPWTATPMLIAPVAGKLADRYGNRPFMIVGLALQAIGLAWVALIASPDIGYLELGVALTIAGVGTSMTFPTVNSRTLRRSSSTKRPRHARSRSLSTRSRPSPILRSWPAKFATLGPTASGRSCRASFSTRPR